MICKRCGPRGETCGLEVDDIKLRHAGPHVDKVAKKTWYGGIVYSGSPDGYVPTDARSPDGPSGYVRSDSPPALHP